METGRESARASKLLRDMTLSATLLKVWSAAVDAEGHTFYQNHQTEETRYDRPMPEGWDMEWEEQPAEGGLEAPLILKT